MRLKRTVCASNSSQDAAVASAYTVKRGATITDLASEFLARMLDSAGTGNSVVVVPTPTDPAGIRRCARDSKTWSAVKKHTNVERGGSRDPGVRRPGAGRGQLPGRVDVCYYLFCRPQFVFAKKLKSGVPAVLGRVVKAEFESHPQIS